MSDNLQKYIPEFDDDERREKLSGYSKEELLEMLIMAYRLQQVLAKKLDEETGKLRRIQEITEEPSKLLNMPGIPGPDDLRKMME